MTLLAALETSQTQHWALVIGIFLVAVALIIGLAMRNGGTTTAVR
jgi:ABC-type lipoprotein release transport system permease subunit